MGLLLRGGEMGRKRSDGKGRETRLRREGTERKWK